MLIMKCPECQERIHSDLLAEVQILTCPHCHVEVPVSDILASANGLTFERNDLIKNIFRYKRMLQETIAERKQMANGTQVSDEAQRHRIDHLIGALQGVLEGARRHIRYQFNAKINASVRFRNQEVVASLVNLSMDGCRLALSAKDTWPASDERLNIEINGHAEDVPKLQIEGKVCWLNNIGGDAQSSLVIGVDFDTITDTEKAQILSFICALVDSENLKMES
jgi:Tfp pilus assembly protein PilZ